LASFSFKRREGDGVALTPAAVVAWSSLLLLGLTGCAGADRIYNAIYDGLRAREDLVAPSAPRSVGRDKPMTFTEYDAERRRALEGDTAR
jgi:hypothetical protein